MVKHILIQRRSNPIKSLSSDIHSNYEYEESQVEAGKRQGLFLIEVKTSPTAALKPQ